MLFCFWYCSYGISWLNTVVTAVMTVVTDFSKRGLTFWSPQSASRWGCKPSLSEIYTNTSTPNHTISLKSHNGSYVRPTQQLHNPAGFRCSTDLAWMRPNPDFKNETALSKRQTQVAQTQIYLWLYEVLAGSKGKHTSSLPNCEHCFSTRGRAVILNIITGDDAAVGMRLQSKYRIIRPWWFSV